jgi:hypothetical protein
MITAHKALTSNTDFCTKVKRKPWGFPPPFRKKKDKAYYLTRLRKYVFNQGNDRADNQEEFDTAADRMLVTIEDDVALQRHAYFIVMKARRNIPDWNQSPDDFENAIVFMVPLLERLLYVRTGIPFRSLSCGDYWRLWGGLAEHLLMTASIRGIGEDDWDRSKVVRKP